MANNDPNYFLTTFGGDFNSNSTDSSGYGILPAAEQNQTYVAYFNSVAGTGPELIDQTGYFIKYLIDKDGNVTKPAPGNTALLNLKDNFELGKPVIVESKNATQALAKLIGEYTVTEVGTISPLLITEIGYTPTSIAPFIEFYSVDSNLATGTAFDFNFNVRKRGNYTFSTGGPLHTSNGGSPDLDFDIYVTTGSSTLSGNWTPTSGVYLYNAVETPASEGNPVKATLSLVLRQTNSSTIFYNNGYQVEPYSRIYMSIEIDRGSGWEKLPISNTSTTNGVTPNPNLGSINDDTNQYSCDIIGNSSKYCSITTDFITPTNGDKLRAVFNAAPIYDSLTYKLWNEITNTWDFVPASTSDKLSLILYGSPTTINSSFTILPSSVNATVTAPPYWDGATYPTSPNDLQYITASSNLSAFLNNNMVQITPTASLSMSFSDIIYPANIQPGDNIRFEYNPQFQSKIYGVDYLDDGRFILKIHPSIPTGSNLNHFVIWRTIDDGNYVTLNVEKRAVGQISGWLKPKYMSKELTDNFTNIINKLEADGLLT